MAKNFSSFIVNSSTDATFRAWGKFISDCLAAGGFVKTEDTGQINWATVTAPGSSGYAGYEIWRSNDAAEAVVNFYVRIQYGRDSTGGVAIGIIIGWSSDGAGNINSTTKSGLIALTQASGASGSAVANYVSAGNNWMAVCLSAGVQPNVWFGIERLLGANGELTNTILMSGSWNTGAGSVSQVIPQAGYAVPALETSNTYLRPIYNSANGFFNSQTGVGLVFGQMGGLVGPSRVIFGGYTTHYAPQGTVVTIDSFGESHDYIFTTTGGYPVFNNAVSGSGVLMRFED